MYIILIKNIVKYGIITGIGILLIYQFLPIGDYCTGLGNYLNALFLIGLLILILFLLTFRNLLRIKKKTFDFIPLLLTLFFGIMWYILLQQTDKKFWTKKSLVAVLEIEGTPKSGTLQLFKNGSFAASYHHADYSCTFQGDYKIKGNKLELKRPELAKLTENVFTSEYTINRNDSILKPTKKGFKVMAIREITTLPK